jgi:hypothetical protein
MLRAKNMSDKKAIADARRFFRKQADLGWGYLTRKKKKGTAREQAIFDAKVIYWQGIKRACEIYTKDNEIVKHANEALEKAISQAHELYLKDEDRMSDKDYEQAKKLFVKAVFQAHDECAEKVAPVWKAFIKDMQKKY